MSQQLPSKKRTAPSPTNVGTLCLIGGILFAFVSFPSGFAEGSTAMAGSAARFVGIGFALSVCFDATKGLRNLFRVDLLCIFAIYGLTLLEFIFPQEVFENMTTPEETSLSITIVLVGIFFLSIGRHLVPPKPIKSKLLALSDISNDSLFKVILIAGFLGFLYMLMSVQFNLFEMINAMTGARFSQPWGRSRLGGLNSLIIELKMLTYAVPPLTAVALNSFKQIPAIQLAIIIFICGLVFFDSIAGGSRNIFIAHISTFLMAYLIVLPKNTLVNTLAPIAFTVWLSGFVSYHMLEFRTIGIRNYIENEVYASGQGRESFAADYNLASIGWVASEMPDPYPFLGWEVVTWSLLKPIPRALLPGKPEGLSVSIEEIAGAQGWTVAVTYLGEAYIGFGMLGVIGVSLFIGALAAWWNRMMIVGQSDYGLVVYALGFFAAGITMRSMFWLTTAILPVIALIVFRKYGPLK
ncbi:MAG: O-antigen polymerase [Limnothrix sp.]